MSAARDHIVVRPDGRRVSWREAGVERGGRTVVHFHGYPGSRLEIALVDGVARQLGLTMLAVERPGFGLSTRQPGRTLLDWPADVTAILDARGDERVLVSGASGGAPYALALAHAHPGRVERVALMCGLGPLVGGDELLAGMPALNRVGIRAWQRRRALAWPLARVIMGVAAHMPAALWVRFLCGAPPPDRDVLRAGLARVLAASFRAGVHAGGMLDELDLIVSEWPFALEDVRVPVHMWHGERDAIVPPAVARQFERRLPDVRASWYPDDGHFSLIARHMADMLREVCAAG